VRKRVFIVHGRDIRAQAELVKFLHALNIEDIPFESVEKELDSDPFIANIVLSAIEQADAVIALFTPDEQAVLYHPETGQSEAAKVGGSRWQARPNVIFEAGVAYAKRDKRPILAVLGADVNLFSDVHGVHFVQLASAEGKRNLFNKLEKALGPIEPVMDDWETSPAAGDFRHCVRSRWAFFDEVHELERYVKNRKVKSQKRAISLLEIIRTVIRQNPSTDWTRLHTRDFMEEVDRHFDEDITDDAYWWLLVYGFFRFDDINEWGVAKNATWDDSCDEARLSERGAALMERLKILSAPETSKRKGKGAVGNGNRRGLKPNTGG
jgi:hypothetical protein